VISISHLTTSLDDETLEGSLAAELAELPLFTLEAKELRLGIAFYENSTEVSSSETL
jgi:hypothetical protein